MIIEVLFPEIANLYGDLQNIEYLKRADESIQVVEDSLVKEPYFINNEPNLIYMGTTTEDGQKLAIEALKLYRERLKELIDKGVYFLFTGNALEILGEKIENKNGFDVEGLGIFPIVSRGDLMKRFNSLYLGDFDRNILCPIKAYEGGKSKSDIIKIVGFKSQFAHSYWTEERPSDFTHVFNTERGIGLNPEIAEEGVRKNNFFGTYLIGPLLILNPYFTISLLNALGLKDARLPFQEDAIKAYEVRVEEYSQPDRGFYY